MYICAFCQMCNPRLMRQPFFTIHLWMLSHLSPAFLKDLSLLCLCSSSISHSPNRLGLAITGKECNEPQRAQHAWCVYLTASQVINSHVYLCRCSRSNVSSITSLQDSKMVFTFIMNEIIWLLLLAAKRFRDSPVLSPVRSRNDERNIAAFLSTHLIHQSPRQSVHS